MGHFAWAGLDYVCQTLLATVGSPQAALWVCDADGVLRLAASRGLDATAPASADDALFGADTITVTTHAPHGPDPVAVLAVPAGDPSQLQRVLDDAAPALATLAEIAEYHDKAILADGVLEAIADQAAVLNEDGVILQTNSSWTRTPVTHRKVIERSPVGSVYQDALRSQTSRPARLAAEGVEAVLRQQLPSFQSDYDTDVEGNGRSYSLQVDPLAGGGAVVRHIDISFRKHLQRELAHRATHDPLTGLPNRVVLDERLGQALLRSERTGSGIALLFCDVDAFKQINDSLGHEVGDTVLTTIARRLQETVRQSDVVTRFGGDEFVVLLDDIDEETAWQRASEMQSAVSKPIIVDGRPLHFTVSIGISAYDGTSHGDGSVEPILRDADAAMYEAKRAGRGTIRAVAARSPQPPTLPVDTISLQLQPIIDLDSGAPVCFEACARLDLPDQRQLIPADFLQRAEETGEIIDIGRRVLDQAVDFALTSGTAVSVNVSWAELSQPHYAETVLGCLLANGLAANRLEVEVLMPAATQIAALTSLRRLREAGVAITIDAFGRQPVDLAALPQLAATGLKVDRALTTAALHDKRNARLVRGIVMMAHHFGWTSTAEGIESVEQAAAARSLGFKRGQGFHFGTPIAAAALPLGLDT